MVRLRVRVGVRVRVRVSVRVTVRVRVRVRVRVAQWSFPACGPGARRRLDRPPPYRNHSEVRVRVRVRVARCTPDRPQSLCVRG